MSSHKLDNYLRTYRKRSGFSQEALSYLLGTGDGMKVSRYERNERVPGFETLLALQVAFGAPLEELFAGHFGRARTTVRRRAAVLRRRLEAQAQTPAVLRQVEALSRISNPQ